MPLRSEIREPFERDPAYDHVAIAEPRRQRRHHRLVAFAHRREHGRRRRSQLDLVGIEQIDDRTAEVLTHRAQHDHRASGVVKPEEPAHRAEGDGHPRHEDRFGPANEQDRADQEEHDAESGKHGRAATGPHILG